MLHYYILIHFYSRGRAGPWDAMGEFMCHVHHATRSIHSNKTPNNQVSTADSTPFAYMSAPRPRPLQPSPPLPAALSSTPHQNPIVPIVLFTSSYTSSGPFAA